MRILVVSPGFHGYASTLGRTWATLGHEARVHVYDHVQPFERLGMRMLYANPEHPLSLRMRESLTRRALAAMREYRPHAVLTVRGDLLDSAWWDALESWRMHRVTWMYDELRRMRYQAETLDHVGTIATYSPKDATTLRERGVDAHHVALGYDALSPVRAHRDDAITFIGARYPNREMTLRELANAGVPVRAYGREWSRHPVDQLRTRAFDDPGIPVARQLDRSDAYGTMQGSPATLNLHGDQDGFTMRTFEAPGVGAVQICDRPEVSTFYEADSEVLTYGSDDELIEHCRRVLAEPTWAQRIRVRGRARTLAEHTLAHRLRRLEQLWR